MKKIISIIMLLSMIFPISVLSEDSIERLPGRVLGQESAKIVIEEICKKLLANTIIEDYKINLK